MGTQSQEEKVTKVFQDNFNGNEMFGIWLVDEKGEKTKHYPVISFGMAKAKAIMNHADELKAFVGE